MEYRDYLTRYPEAYRAFSQNMERTQSLGRHITSLGLLDGVRNLFSIGSGEGELEIDIARRHDIAVSVLEPTDLLMRGFDQNAERHSIRVEDRHCESFQDYRGDKQYDLVLSIHSWYAFGFDEELLRKALGCVRPGGAFVLNLASDKSPVSEIAALSRSAGIDLTAEAVSRWASGAGFTHKFSMEHNSRPAALYLAAGGRLTQAGMDFASFLLATPWSDMEAGLRVRVGEILMSHRRGESIDVCSGSLVFRM